MVVNEKGYLEAQIINTFNQKIYLCNFLSSICDAVESYGGDTSRKANNHNTTGL